MRETPRILSRRDLIKLGLGTAGGIAAAFMSGYLGKEKVEELLGFDTPILGQHLAPIQSFDGAFVTIEWPTPIKVDFTTMNSNAGARRNGGEITGVGLDIDSSTYLQTHGKIPFFSSNELAGDSTPILASINDVNAEFAIGTLGGWFMTEILSEDGTMYFHHDPTNVYHKGKVFTGGWGAWYSPANISGKHVNLAGEELKPDEKILYTPSAFIKFT